MFCVELSKLPSDACMSLVAMATKPGHTQVSIKYKVLGVSLETSVTIAAYLPLKVCDWLIFVLILCFHGSQWIQNP